jgi:hypothetical protein
MDVSSQQMSVRLDGLEQSSDNENEKVGIAIMSMRPWFPHKTASWRADAVMKNADTGGV